MAEKHAFDTDHSTPPDEPGGVAAEGEPTVPAESDYPMTIEAAGGSRLRLLLLLLVLVVAGGGYYFLRMSEPAAPSPPPPKVVVAVPSPAPQPVGPVTATPAPPAPSVAVAPPSAAVPAAAPPPAPQTLTAPAVAPAPPAKPVEARPAALPVSGGPWRVETGAYQEPRAAQAVAEKLRGLGYQPQLRTVQRSEAMTRLRLGVFPASEVKDALAAAREVAPDAFALRSGDTFTVYAGTFTRPGNIRRLSAQLANAGVRVEEEPVRVQRTVTLFNFGGFADQNAAAEAAARARQAGIAAEVVTPR